VVDAGGDVEVDAVELTGVEGALVHAEVATTTSRAPATTVAFCTLRSWLDIRTLLSVVRNSPVGPAP
jgi:hypothetical protein